VALEEYVPIVGQPVIDDLRLIGDRLKGRVVRNINSTAVGGGVAEILNRMIPLLKELGVDAHWDVIRGGEQFYNATKKIHNALHGAPQPFTETRFPWAISSSTSMPLPYSDVWTSLPLVRLSIRFM
jgi:trehalose synthase